MASSELTKVPSSPSRSRVAQMLQEIQERREADARDAAQAQKPKPVLVIRDIVVAVMGVTGAGKSSFIRRVTGNEAVEVGNTLRSTTQKVQPFTFEDNGRKFSIIDTPGFNDTERSDGDVLKELAAWFDASYRDGVQISGILYLHRISDVRMEGSAMRNLRMFRKLCGDDFMKNVVLGTTFWDVTDEKTGQAHEDELLQTEGFFKEMVALECSVLRITGNRDDDIQLLERFAAKPPSVMTIQKELFSGKSLAETAAASSSASSEELAELQLQHQKQLGDVEHQAQKIMVRSALETALTRHLEGKAHGQKLEELKTEEDAVRQAGEAEAAAADERLQTLQKEASRRDQAFQVKLDELGEQLRALKGGTT